jgi:hypothetical protein
MEALLSGLDRLYQSWLYLKGERVTTEFARNAIYTLVAIDDNKCTFILSSIVVVIKPDITAGHNILVI